MAKGPGPEQRLTPAERANLVAYLDGELPERESRAIATKLTQSPTARREVELLERTWQLLEHLPRPRAPEDFTERTLTDVRRLRERGGEFESAMGLMVRRLGWVAVWLVGSAAAFGGGYLATYRLWPNPTDRLARDLSLAEHLDEYRDVGSFEYLKELASSPEFLNDAQP
jgi:anti-sigma factor RsiW